MPWMSGWPSGSRRGVHLDGDEVVDDVPGDWPAPSGASHAPANTINDRLMMANMRLLTGDSSFL